uniref:Uncharacterized protein n=1 Tax=Rhizophora mucronata TaxID=61149 RepID=A0A2P2R154_RHIMU
MSHAYINTLSPLLWHMLLPDMNGKYVLLCTMTIPTPLYHVKEKKNRDLSDQVGSAKRMERRHKPGQFDESLQHLALTRVLVSSHFDIKIELWFAAPILDVYIILYDTYFGFQLIV